MTTNQMPFSLEDVVVNSELINRSSRPPDYEAESTALKLLAQTMVDSPETILQTVVETALRLCRAHTAGISLLENHGGQEVFRWEALAGVFADRLNNKMPRNASPCGTTIDRNTTQLMYMAERFFPALKADPPVVEALLIPFHVNHKPIGTVWVMAHDETRKFDREDERIVKKLAQFASVAWQLWKARGNAEQRNRELEARVHEGGLELKDTHRKLEESHVLSALGTAAAKIIHDLANPLNSISTSVQLLERSLAGNLERETIVELVQGLKEENARLQSLIDELRQFTRPLELNLEAVSLAELLSDVSRDTRITANGSYSVGLEQAATEDLPVVMADREKLMRVFLNLCKNAIEAMSDGGKLTLRCYARENNITVEVRDTGGGIPDGVNIFEPFATSKQNGWGLGLSIVKQIVSAHNGTISYVSELGKGTTFKVELPIAEHREQILPADVVR